MDYQVFLISRVREGWRIGQSDSDAVANGLASTGRVITSAAAIMICVFGAFVLGDLRALRLFGFARAAAILLDATLVRMVLMPATLQLLGRANWWFPQWLGNAIPNLMPELEQLYCHPLVMVPDMSRNVSHVPGLAPSVRPGGP